MTLKLELKTLSLSFKVSMSIAEDGHYNRNIQHMLTKLIKFILLDDSTYFSLNMLCVTISFYTKISKNYVKKGTQGINK